MRAVVCGANGAMGKLICEILGDEVIGKVSIDGANNVPKTFGDLGKQEADVVIDFSHHSAVADVLTYAKEIGSAAIIGTTGHTEEEKAMIFAAAEEIPVFYAGNVSLGIAVLCRLVKQAAAIFGGCDVEIIEAHHNRKADAPSGTALLLADAVKEKRPDAEYVFGRSGQHKRQPNEIGIHALRMGNVVGEHEVIFATDNQTISLKHQAHDRALFADGAIAAARFIVTQAPGFYHMDDLLGP